MKSQYQISEASDLTLTSVDSDMSVQKAIIALQSDDVIAASTDTVMGLLVSIKSPKAIEKLISLKGRSPDKPFLILISSLDQIIEMIDFNEKVDCFTRNIWPGPVTVVFHLKHNQKLIENFLPYCAVSHENTVACRLPGNQWLQRVIRHTGPLLAPSANPAGKPVAKNIAEVRDYFNDSLPLIIEEAGTNSDKAPSSIVSISDNQLEVIREGSVNSGKLEAIFEKCKK